MPRNPLLNSVSAAIPALFLVAILVGCQQSATPVQAPSQSAASEDRSWSPPPRSAIQGEENAVLTAPPNVPAPITRDYPTKVIVQLEVQEKVMPMTDGVDYTFWTFGGTVPGSFIRVRQGDLIEFHLANRADSKVPHNIDLHAVTGPGGGAVSSFTPPGKETTFSFQAINPGLYIYHCATAPVGMHIANGMYGLILVEPEGGLPPVDREYYVVQGDFYTRGAFGEPGLQPFDMDKALREEPDYVVFNGAVNAMTGDNALHAKTGETVRLYVGNGGPNLISSFHVIGEIFDKVWVEGGDLINHNIQTTLVPAGGSAIVEFKVEVPGELIMVDHSIFRAFNKGALGRIDVASAEAETIYSGQQNQTVYLPEGSTVQTMPEGKAPAPQKLTPAERIEQGKNVYSANCAACHMPDGSGIPGAFPPVANADYLNEDVARAIRAVGEGLAGEITVNGQSYNNVMPKLNLSHEKIASVLTYVYSQWDNNGTTVTPEMVRKALEK